MSTNTRLPIFLNAAEKSLIREYLKDGIEACDADVSRLKGQKFIKQEKGQIQRVKEYENSIKETIHLKGTLQDLIKKFD